MDQLTKEERKHIEAVRSFGSLTPSNPLLAIIDRLCRENEKLRVELAAWKDDDGTLRICELTGETPEEHRQRMDKIHADTEAKMRDDEARYGRCQKHGCLQRDGQCYPCSREAEVASNGTLATAREAMKYQRECSYKSSMDEQEIAAVESICREVEAMQKVVEAAAKFRDAYQVYIDSEDAELPDTGPELDDALSALAKLKGGAT